MKEMSPKSFEIEMLLKTIRSQYGYDFKDYSAESLSRRIEGFLARRKDMEMESILEELALNKGFFLEFLNEFTVSTTDLFRDPIFFKAFKEKVIPHLKTYSHVKIWVPGCSTGEEVYSLAILLYEADLLQRTLIYGTDINAQAVFKAKKGIHPARLVKRGTRNYFLSGGQETLHRYWTVRHGYALFNQECMKSIVFGEHNLATDHSFGEMQVICCQNVLIYFNRALQNHCLRLFNLSLCKRGFLCIGSKESLLGSSIEGEFEPLNKLKIFRKRN